jgi:uncharacterized protein (UPF0179 family)
MMNAWYFNQKRTKIKQIRSQNHACPTATREIYTVDVCPAKRVFKKYKTGNRWNNV